MANPQKENGYTAIANEIMDKLARTPIRSEVRRILDFVLRKTYGFNKLQDKISLSQLAEGTNMKRSSVCRAKKEAVAKQLLHEDENGLSFNKNHDEWVVAKRLPLVAKQLMGGSKTANRVVAKQRHTKVDITKVNITKEIYCSTFDQFWKLYPKKVAKNKAAIAWSKISPEEQQKCIEVIPEHKKQAQWSDIQFIPHPATWINQGRWKDEIQPPKKWKEKRKLFLCSICNEIMSETAICSKCQTAETQNETQPSEFIGDYTY